MPQSGSNTVLPTPTKPRPLPTSKIALCARTGCVIDRLPIPPYMYRQLRHMPRHPCSPCASDGFEKTQSPCPSLPARTDSSSWVGDGCMLRRARCRNCACVHGFCSNEAQKNLRKSELRPLGNSVFFINRKFYAGRGILFFLLGHVDGAPGVPGGMSALGTG